jgi:hypothetical protein
MARLLKGFSLIVFVLSFFSVLVFAEDITITTYYPSPYGVYNQLTTTGTTLLATTSGNVGIGTTTPGYPLMVYKAVTGDVQVQIANGTKNLYIGAQWINNIPSLGTNDATSLGLVTNNGERIHIDSSGSIGIATTSPGATLEVNGKVKIDDLTQAGGGASVLTSSGILTTVASSIRYKENVRDYEGVLGKLGQLRPVHFTWKASTATPGMEDFGFIAEDVSKIFPELTTYEKDGKTIRGLKYEKLPILLTKAIQEQQDIIKAQQLEITGLKERLDKLEGKQAQAVK